MPRWGVTPALLLVVLTALTACAKKEPAPEPVRAVRAITVTAQAAGGSQEYAAEIRARTESRLGFRVAGKMIIRPAEIGQRVRAGQMLAQLDPADLKLSQAAAQAALRAAQSSHALAVAEFKRYQDLRDQGFISSLELERRDTAVTAQRAQLDQARAQADVQGNLATYAALTANAAGVITAVEAEVGAVLAAGTPVLRLAHDGPRDAVFSVPEDSAVALRALHGKAGAITVRPWGNTGTFPATVREVAAAADPATRTFLVKADVGAAPVQLGQTITALMALPRRDGIAKLPLTAVMRQQGQTAVWLLDRNSMRVQVQPIAVAGAEGNEVIVASGLSPGQMVVTAGVHTLTPNQKVKLYEAPVAAVGAAPGAGAAPVAAAASR
ncbi:MAG: efflux RND transporter periplasmic adaptor subunit [Rubrivivax sp.]|nr:efflux RND transporter periplasmic adaptor subunit [Rubrivivax sp.]